MVKPVVERQDPELGRVLLKIVSPRYLEKAKDLIHGWGMWERMNRTKANYPPAIKGGFVHE